jgi:hypothetical protein
MLPPHGGRGRQTPRFFHLLAAWRLPPFPPIGYRLSCGFKTFETAALQMRGRASDEIHSEDSRSPADPRLFLSYLITGSPANRPWGVSALRPIRVKKANFYRPRPRSVYAIFERDTVFDRILKWHIAPNYTILLNPFFRSRSDERYGRR